ncbi:MAG: sigma-54 dependent transcriptional regulator [bacterium]|nr:sigma-54 dependent transcriptional regulator [bacterium]
MSRVLVVDDHDSVRSGVALLIERMGHCVDAAGNGYDALELCAAGAYDLVVTDFRMAGMDGLQLLQTVKERWPATDVIMVTAHGSIDVAVQAMQHGAADFVEKTDLYQVLPIKIARILEQRLARHERDRLGAENEYLREEISDRFGEIVGNSAVILRVLGAVEKVGGTDSSVLLYGESGTGKELVARALHRSSPRRDGPFVRVNCGALPRELVESELFGHEKGAFTNAVRQRKGKFELAEKGTIFLDEIADLPLDTQVNLLRVLQEKEYDRVGGETTLKADVRVVAATNRSLTAMVADGTFREDLFYRLEVIPLHLPPLRERKDDIPLLVEHFLVKKSREINVPLRRLTPEAMRILCDYPWPGNVRELENIIERTIVLSDGETIGPADLPFDSSVESPLRDRVAIASGGVVDASEAPLTARLESLERDLIQRAMQQARGVKTQAAELLGIKTSALYYKLDKYGVEYAEE